VALIAVGGIVISLYYYFGIIRAIYWSDEPKDLSTIPLSKPMRFAIYGCIIGMFFVGIFPGWLLNAATEAVKSSLTH
jgi:NADH:ubiquinone oxidoreductase subunit 2 (subunit N)